MLRENSLWWIVPARQSRHILLVTDIWTRRSVLRVILGLVWLRLLRLLELGRGWLATVLLHILLTALLLLVLAVLLVLWILLFLLAVPLLNGLLELLRLLVLALIILKLVLLILLVAVRMVVILILVEHFGRNVTSYLCSLCYILNQITIK